MNLTTYEKGYLWGVQLVLIRFGNKRFGQLQPEIEARIKAIHDEDRLNELIDRVFEVQSWDELLQMEGKS